mgnify:CR=1 FL=1
MKVIDLLNKIANNEEVPKKFKYMGYCYSWCESCEIHEATDEKGYRFNLYDFIAKKGNLNDKIEIIEEKPKKIEEVDICIMHDFNATNGNFQITQINFKRIVDKVNELQKAVNYLLEKESDK